MSEDNENLFGGIKDKLIVWEAGNAVTGVTGVDYETCLLKHEIALYTESTEAVCGKSDCLNTPFVTQSFHYILGNCNHKYTFYYLVFPYLSFI